MPENSPPPINRWNSQDYNQRSYSGVIVALVLAIVFHAGLFWYLKKIEFFKPAQTEDFDTQEFFVDQVVLDDVAEIAPVPETKQTIADFSEPEELIAELDDILPELKNQDIDIKTDIESPELSIEMSAPIKAGEEDGALDDILLSASSLNALEELGTGITDNTLADEGQIIIKQGSVEGELLDPNEVLDDAISKGLEGLSENGVMEGYNSLDELLSMSNINLAGARSALPSDLLFEYDSADLKSAARFGLMKLGMLIDRNPDMYCVLEGHTDTFGPDSYNKDLSQQRSQAVKSYLVDSLRLEGDNIIVRGYGKTVPLIGTGTVEEQAANRRVDILMRNEIPPVQKNKPTKSSPPKVTEVKQNTEQPTKKAVVVKAPKTPEPPKTTPVKENPPNRQAPPKKEVIQRAIVIDEQPTHPVKKAILVKPARDPNPPQRAIIIEEPENIAPRRAIPVNQ